MWRTVETNIYTNGKTYKAYFRFKGEDVYIGMNHDIDVLRTMLKHTKKTLQTQKTTGNPAKHIQQLLKEGKSLQQIYDETGADKRTIFREYQKFQKKSRTI